MKQRDIKRLRPPERVCSHNSRTNDTFNRCEGVITGAPRSQYARCIAHVRNAYTHVRTHTFKAEEGEQSPVEAIVRGVSTHVARCRRASEDNHPRRMRLTLRSADFLDLPLSGRQDNTIRAASWLDYRVQVIIAKRRQSARGPRRSRAGDRLMHLEDTRELRQTVGCNAR